MGGNHRIESTARRSRTFKRCANVPVFARRREIERCDDDREEKCLERLALRVRSEFFSTPNVNSAKVIAEMQTSPGSDARNLRKAACGRRFIMKIQMSVSNMKRTLQCVAKLLGLLA